MTPYIKPYLDLDQQIALLKSRGMLIDDEQKAKEYLHRTGYYRLSGYWYPFRKSTASQLPSGILETTVLDNFRENSQFKHVIDLYIFDKKLRILFLDALERIEIALRVDVALILGKEDKFAQHREALLDGNFTKKVNLETGQTDYQAWLRDFNRLVSKSKEDFITHFKGKYDLPLPIWIAVELWDFGLLSKFITGMRYQELQSMSARYSIPRSELLKSWVRAMNYIRNVCAHHSRLWNRSPTSQIKLSKLGEIPLLDHLNKDSYGSVRIYATAAVIQYFLRLICPRSEWSARLKNHLETFPAAPGVKVSQTGFPSDWQNLQLWK
jgi:abortive infection bacteriophage resistance protein